MNMKNVYDSMNLFKLLLVGVFIVNSMTALAKENINHKLVIAAAEKYVSENIVASDLATLNISAKALDKRLKIPRCPLSLDAEASENALRQSNVSVKVSCKTNHWYIYVTVNVKETQPVIVAMDALSPGTLLTKDNVKIVEMEKKRLRSSTFADIDSVIGARLKRRIRPGQAISPEILCFVCKGDAIVITANISGLHIKTSGIAEQDGNIGDTIMVKNSKSKKIIDAQVTSVKRVEVHI